MGDVATADWCVWPMIFSDVTEDTRGGLMIVGVPRETFPGERRVALVPSVVPTLAKSGLEVVVEAGAGIEAGYPDADYTAKGAKVLSRAR